MYGAPVSDAVAWDVFPTRWDAHKYIRNNIKNFMNIATEVDK
jgi:hypothetical protein